MTTRVITTGYGQPALQELAALVADVKADDPLTSVTVLVPNQVASVVVRRHLASGAAGQQGVAGLFLSTVDRLAERLAAPLLSPRRPATRPILAAAWRSALADAPGMFAQIREHQSTVTALLSVHRELRALDEAQLTEVTNGSRLAADVVRLHTCVRTRVEAGFYDENDLLRAATQLLLDDESARAELGAIILYLPENLSVPQQDLVAALAPVEDLTVIAGCTGLARPDRPTLTTVERLTDVAELPERNQPTATRVFHASDSDDEVRYVVRELLTRLQSVPAHRIGVLYANSSPYARLLHEHLSTAGIRHNGAGSRPTLERSIPQGVTRLLDALTRDLPRADLFEALANARIQQDDGAPAPVVGWERVSRLAGVVGGDDWGRRLHDFAEREQRRAAEEAGKDDPYESVIARCRRNSELASSLSSFVGNLRIYAVKADHFSWRDLSHHALELFHHLYGQPDELLRLPPDERDAARDVELALRSVADLVAFEPGPAGLHALLDVLTAELEASLPRVGRFGEGVFVGPLSAAVGLDLDVVYVLGLSEDLYPGRLHPEPLVAESIRRSSGGALRTQRDRVDSMHRHLLAAFQVAPDVTACFPRGNLRRSQPRLPSRWLVPTLRTLTGDRELVASRWDRVSAPTILSSPSYATEVETTALPATAQEWRMRAFRSHVNPPDPVVSAATTMISGRAASELTRFDGLVMAENLPSYADGDLAVSPTRLEEYAGCPHAFFVRRLLRVEPIEHPEEIVTISPLEIGNLMHEAMDAMISEFSDERLPGFGEPWLPVHRRRLHDHAIDLAQQVQDRGVTGHPRLWRAERSRILRDLDRMLIEDDRWRLQRDARVVASELVFGLEGRPPVRLELEHGTVLLKGKADKIDITRDGVIVVTDIKTGRSVSYQGLTKDPVLRGTKLQLPAYAQAALDAFGGREARAEYWFVRKDKGRVGLDLTEENQARYRDAIATLIESISRGIFVGKPPVNDYAYACSFCSPDGVSPGDLRTRWAHKRNDSRMQRLVSLIDPTAVQGDPA